MTVTLESLHGRIGDLDSHESIPVPRYPEVFGEIGRRFFKENEELWRLMDVVTMQNGGVDGDSLTVDRPDDKEITQLFAGYLKEPHFPIRTSAIFALGTRGDASAIPALEAALNRDDLSIEMAPMIKSQIEHLKNSSAPGGAHGGAGSGSASSEKNPGDQRLVHLEQLVQEMNDRLKAIEGRLPPAAKPQGLR